MIYRIVATIVLIVAIVAVGVALEPSAQPRKPAAPTQGVDDAAFRNLKIN